MLSRMSIINLRLPCHPENSGHVRNFMLNFVSGRNLKKNLNVLSFSINQKQCDIIKYMHCIMKHEKETRHNGER